MIIIKKILPGIGILTLGAVMIAVFKAFPSVTDALYTNGIFTILRVIYDFTIGYIPFAFIYIVFPVLIYFLLRTAIEKIRKEGLLLLLASLFNFIAIFFFLFYLFWGFNYYASSVSERMELHNLKLNGEYLKSELSTQYDVLIEKRLLLSIDSILVIPIDKRKQEKGIRNALESVLAQLKYSTKGRVRVRELIPGILMRLRTSGIYIPYVFEGHFDSSIHPLQWNNTLAHEMAHGYGVTDEGECNFLAYLVCSKIDDVYIQYSAEMSYYRYLARAVIRYDGEYYNSFREGLDFRILSDLDQINVYLNKYKELMPIARDKIYDNYLKAHGVEDGIVSYDRMVELIAAYRAKQ